MMNWVEVTSDASDNIGVGWEQKEIVDGWAIEYEHGITGAVATATVSKLTTILE